MIQIIQPGGKTFLETGVQYFLHVCFGFKRNLNSYFGVLVFLKFRLPGHRRPIGIHCTIFIGERITANDQFFWNDLVITFGRPLRITLWPDHRI